MKSFGSIGRISERDLQTYNEFLKQDQEEEKMFHVDEDSSMADYSRDNSGSLENLHQQIDEIATRKIGLEAGDQ